MVWALGHTRNRNSIMVFVGCIIFPHGAMVFDGDPNSSSTECQERHRSRLPPEIRDKCTKLYKGCVEAADTLVALKPDVVLLHTPHGLSLSKSLAVYLNSTAEGTAQWNNQWQDFKVQVSCDADVAASLLQHFEASNVSAEGLNCFTGTEAPLRWGEAIPIWYIQQALKKSNCETKFVILAQSRRPRGSCGSMSANWQMAQSMAMGKALEGYIASSQKRIAVAVSGDLSHAFHTDCQDELYMPDPRWNMPVSDEEARAFSHAIQAWCTSVAFKSDDPLSKDADLPDATEEWKPEVAQPWLQTADILNNKALSCGIGGFEMLHGLLENLVASGIRIQARHLVNEAPTYYGMMVATFLPQS